MKTYDLRRFGINVKPENGRKNDNGKKNQYGHGDKFSRSRSKFDI